MNDVKAPNITKDNPDINHLTKILVEDPDNSAPKVSNYRDLYNTTMGAGITKISESVSERIINNDSITSLFPDMELAIQILVSSILSPKDMIKSTLIYNIDTDIIPPDVALSIINAVKDYIEEEYDITDKLDIIVRDMLFESGAYVTAVIPPSVIDKIISGDETPSTESLSSLITNDSITHKGILGTSQSNIGLESLTKRYTTHNYNPSITIEYSNQTLDLGIEVIDNYEMLKLPLVRKRIANNNINTILENNTNTLDLSKYYRKTKKEYKPLIKINNTDISETPDTKPLVMRLPTEAVIPVHTPGDHTDHVGYFILLDENGYPVKTDVNSKKDLEQLLTGESKIVNLLIQRTRKNIRSSENRGITLKNATKIFSKLIEDELINRLKNGVYGEELEIPYIEDIYRIMLARTLKSKSTKILYIPRELITYFAYKYYPNGTGKSLMDDLAIISSLRAILMFAKVSAMVKNSIAITHVDIELDENDPDPQKTIEMAKNEILQVRQQYFPLGINTPTDIVDWLNKAGFEFSFSGHPGLPNTKIEFSSKSFDHKVVDDDIDEELRKQSIMALGLSPETVDNGFSGDFATTVVANNILLAKRIIQIQGKFTPKLTEHIQKLCRYDYNIRKTIIDILKNNKDNLIKDQYLKEMSDTELESTLQSMTSDIINEIEVTLPKPDTTKLQSLSEEFSTYKDSLDSALEAWVSEELLSSELVGDVSDKIETIKNNVRAYFLRKWMAENGYMTELADLTTTDDEGNPVLNLYEIAENHAEAIIKSAAEFLAKFNSTKKEVNKKVEAMDGDETDGPEEDNSPWV